MIKKSFILTLCFLGAPLVVHGAGAILVDSGGTGQPVLWEDGIVRYNLESTAGGTLGSLSNGDAVTLVHDLFDDWRDVTIGAVSTTSITLDEGTSLGAVDASNMDDHFTYCPPDESCPSESSPFVIGSARSGDSPILFDDDGSMTDAVQGTGAKNSILGFAGPRVVERSGGVLMITEGQAILNGRFIDGTDTSTNPEVTVADFKGAIFHELGHFIGLDHSQVNLSSVVLYLSGNETEKAGIPTMLPLFVDGTEQLTPHFDDKVAVSSLYPSSDYETQFCFLNGTTFLSNGTTEVQGVNVVATNQADTLGETTSSVSGSLFVGNASGCDVENGDFEISGLTPGQTYTLRIEKISQAFTGGSSLEPCDPPQTGFDAATLSGTFSCASGGQVITSGTQVNTLITTTKAAGNAAAVTTSSGGGCSLLPF